MRIVNRAEDVKAKEIGNNIEQRTAMFVFVRNCALYIKNSLVELQCIQSKPCFPDENKDCPLQKSPSSVHLGLGRHTTHFQSCYHQHLNRLHS